MLPWWLARTAAAGLALALAEPLTVRVVPNGSPASADPLVVEADGWGHLRAQVERHFGKVLQHDPTKEWWITDENGTALSSWEELLSRGPSPLVGAVPSGRLFQWGPRAIGERFPVKISDREGVEIETVSHSPRLFLIHNLMSNEEAVGLIEQSHERTGENALTTSGVGFVGGKRNTQSLRTSASAFDSETPIAKKVLQRAFEVARVPHEESFADGLQILRYKTGQAYISHKDWFPFDSGTDDQNFNPEEVNGVNRFATVFLYLWSPPSGGYTVFPLATIEPEVKDSPFVSTGRDTLQHHKAMKLAHKFFNETAWEYALTDKCYTRLAVKPVQLGAALFYHQDPMTGTLLDAAEHGACPSLTGTKWGANLWIWNAARHQTSSQANSRVSAEFLNSEAMPIDLAWSTDEGNTWVFFGQAAVGNILTANTFSNHWWRFTEAGTQKEIRRYVVPEKTPSVRFSSHSSEPISPPDKPHGEL